MFDKFRLKEVLVEYKKRFVQQQWPNEKYKWEVGYFLFQIIVYKIDLLF